MDGWIGIHRKIAEWEWYSDSNTSRVFFDLLFSVNHTDTKYKGHEIKKGQTITGYPSMAKRLGISVQNARTAINHLKSTGEITVKVTSKFSIVTLLNYTKYEIKKKEVNNQTNRQTNSHLTVIQQSSNNTQKGKEHNNVINKKTTFSSEHEILIEKFNQLTNRTIKLNNERVNLIKRAIGRGHTTDDILTAFIKRKETEWWCDNDRWKRFESLFNLKTKSGNAIDYIEDFKDPGLNNKLTVLEKAELSARKALAN